MSEPATNEGLDDVDPRLLEEAFRRARQMARNRDADSADLLASILTAARQGVRDMHGLVAAASRDTSRAA